MTLTLFKYFPSILQRLELSVIHPQSQHHAQLPITVTLAVGLFKAVRPLEETGLAQPLYAYSYRVG